MIVDFIAKARFVRYLLTDEFAEGFGVRKPGNLEGLMKKRKGLLHNLSESLQKV